MSIALPLLGVLLAAIAAYLSTRQTGASPPANSLGVPHFIGVALLLLLGMVLSTQFGNELDRAWTAIGLGVGAVAALLGSLRPIAGAGSAAIGLGAAACLHIIPAIGVAPAQTALLASIGLMSILTGSYPAALAAGCVVMLDKFGKLAAGSETLAMAGTILSIVLLLAYVLSIAIPAKATWRRIILFAVPIAATAALNQAMGTGSFAVIATAGVITAAVLYALFNDETSTPVTYGIATLISIGLATASFALGRGTGMATALLCSAGVLLLAERPRAVLALGPLFGLTLFRLFRNLYPETSRAFDIGQHYALIGLMIGAILPLVLIDARPFAERLPRSQYSLIVLALVALILAPIMTIFFGPIGTVGLLVGLGFAGTVELLRQGTSLLALSTGIGISGATIISYGWLAKSLEMTRDEKIRVLMFTSLGIVIAAGVFALLTRGDKREA